MQAYELKNVLEAAFPGQLQIESIESRVNFTITATAVKRFFAEAEFFKSMCIIPQSNSISLVMSIDQAIKLKHTIS